MPRYLKIIAGTLFLFSLFCFPKTAKATLTDNLVGYWNFDGNSNDSLNVLNGTDTDINYSPSYGILGQGALFNGSSSEITIPDNSLYKNNHYTISGWVWTNFNGNTKGWGSIGLDFNNNQGIYMEGWSNNGLIWGVYDTAYNGRYVFYNNIEPYQNWSFLVLTYDGSIMKVYQNGTQISPDGGSNFSGSWNTIYSNTGIQFGAAATDFWNGYIDEVGIWSRALTQTEITTLYNNGTGLTYPFIVPTSTTPTSTTSTVNFNLFINSYWWPIIYMFGGVIFLALIYMIWAIYRLIKQAYN